MKPTTIRLPEELLDQLDEEASEHNFATRTEYLRYLIDNRELVVSIALEERKDRVRSLADRVEELEERMEELEAQREEAVAASGAIESVEELIASTEREQDDAVTLELDGEDDTGEPEPAPPDLEIPDDEPEPLELRDPGPEEIRQRVSRLEFFAPTREIRHEREEAVTAAWMALVEHGELSRDDFEEIVFGDHMATFSTFAGWYDRLLEPALDQLEDVERVGADTWRYVG